MSQINERGFKKSKLERIENLEHFVELFERFFGNLIVKRDVIRGNTVELKASPLVSDFIRDLVKMKEQVRLISEHLNIEFERVEEKIIPEHIKIADKPAMNRPQEKRK